MTPIRIALVGIGKIAVDQHLPALKGDNAFELAAAVSRSSRPNHIPTFQSLDDLIASDIKVDAVSFATPPQGRYELASTALEAGYHVMLEKPPAASVSEVEVLAALARERSKTLFTTWHSREAAAVEPAKAWLAGREIRRVEISWKEDVRRWHPGQGWIWQAGGLGVFDPGINALSIVTKLFPDGVRLTEAELVVPANCEAPIAAKLQMATRSAPVVAEFDWRQTGPQTWDITVETSSGTLLLTQGGAEMHIDGASAFVAADAEYPRLYKRFAKLIAARVCDVDVAPFRLVADAFLLGRRTATDPFTE